MQNINAQNKMNELYSKLYNILQNEKFTKKNLLAINESLQAVYSYINTDDIDVLEFNYQIGQLKGLIKGTKANVILEKIFDLSLTNEDGGDITYLIK